MQQYGREYLADLSIEMMVEYIHRIVLPSMVAEERSATVEEVRENETSYQEEVKAILKRYGLACICPATVYRWMKSLGFSYEQRKNVIMLMAMKSHHLLNTGGNLSRDTYKMS